MDPKQHIIDQIFLNIDDDVKTIDRITSFMRTMLADGDARKYNMEEISKLPKSKLHEQGFIYNLILNEKDIEIMSKLEDIISKIRAIIDMKLGFLKQIVEM